MDDAITKTAPSSRTRRVVTGHGRDGRSCIISDAECAVSVSMHHPDFVVTDAWRVDSLPADNSTYVDPCRAMELESKPTGNVVRIVQFPPDKDYLPGMDIKAAAAELGSTGAAALADYEGAPHPMMHKSNSLDYIIIISGEIYAVMEDGETLLRPGDVLIQRGTNHAWSNRSDGICVMAAILNGAEKLMIGQDA